MYKTYYLDENDNLVSSDKAIKIICQELDENGNIVNETYSYTKNYHPVESQRVKDHVLSPEAQKDIDNIKKQLEESLNKTK